MGYQGIIVGVTGNLGKDQIEQFMNNGADIVLGKPVPKQALVNVLKKKF